MTLSPSPKSCAPASEADLDAYCTTGSSPTNPHAGLHVIGLGAVGRALLQSLNDGPFRLLGVTDSSGTARLDSEAHSPNRIAEIKAQGGSVSSHLSGSPLSLCAAIDWVDAEVVVDLTATDFTRPEWATALQQGVLDNGRTLVLAAKDALCLEAPAWLRGRYAGRLGINAVLGGTGGRLVRELPYLRTACRSAALVGSASTTAIIEAIERGCSLDEGIEAARGRGLLEADPELDLRGADAAVKLAIVAGALRGRAVDPAGIPCEDIRDVDPGTLRRRASEGQTTRLIGRLDESGGLSLEYEALPVEHPLAVPCERVAYLYECTPAETRAHFGDGLGAENTAAAVYADLEELATHRRLVPGEAQ